MELKVFDGGKRVFGFAGAMTDRIEMIGESEPVERTEAGEVEYGYTMGELGKNIVPPMPEEIRQLLQREAQGAVTVSRTAQAVSDYLAVGHRLCAETGMELDDLLHSVKVCEKENRRHRRGRERLKVRVADAIT